MSNRDKARMTKVLLIGGGSGSGKTWLAHAVMARLWADAALVSQDDFYRDLADQRGAGPELDAARVDFDHPDTLDFTLMAECLRDVVAGHAANIPHYDFATHRRQPGRILQPAPFVVVEGILVLGQPELRELADLSVFVRAPEHVRFGRRLARDVQERGRTSEDATRQMREQVFPAHDRFVEPSAIHADLVLDAADLEADLDGAVADICSRLSGPAA